MLFKSWISVMLVIFECYFNCVAVSQVLQQCDGCPALQPGAQYPPGTFQSKTEVLLNGTCRQTIICNNLQTDIISNIKIFTDGGDTLSKKGFPHHSLYGYGTTSANISLNCVNEKWHYIVAEQNYTLASYNYYCIADFRYVPPTWNTPYGKDTTSSIICPSTALQECGSCPTISPHHSYPSEMTQNKTETFPNGTCQQTITCNNIHFDLYKRLYGTNSYITIQLSAGGLHPKYDMVSTAVRGYGQKSATISVKCINGKWFKVMRRQLYEIIPSYYECNEHIINTKTLTYETPSFAINACTYCSELDNLFQCYTGYGDQWFYFDKSNPEFQALLQNETTEYCEKIVNNTEYWKCCPKSKLLPSSSPSPIIATQTTIDRSTSVQTEALSTTTTHVVDVKKQCDGCPALQPGAQYPPGTFESKTEVLLNGTCRQTIICNNLQSDIISNIKIYTGPGIIPSSRNLDTSTGKNDKDSISFNCVNGTWYWYTDITHVLSSHNYFCQGFVKFPYNINTLYDNGTMASPSTSIQQCTSCATFTTHYLYPPEMLQRKTEISSISCKHTITCNNIHSDLYKRLYNLDSYLVIELLAVGLDPKYGMVSTNVRGYGQKSATISVKCINGKWFKVVRGQFYEITPISYKCEVFFDANIFKTPLLSDNICIYCRESDSLTECFTGDGNKWFYFNKSNLEIQSLLQNDATGYCVKTDNDTEYWRCCPKNRSLPLTTMSLIGTTQTAVATALSTST